MYNDVVKLKNKFDRLCITIGEIPTSFKLSMTYEEQLLWFCNYLENTVIPAINNNAEITQEIQDYIKNLDINFDKIEQEIADMKIYIENELNYQINLINNRIDQIELGEIEVYNPTTGVFENINKVLNDIYDSVRYDAITASEFDALELTATAFDAVEITAYNFDNNGKSILTNI